MKRSKLALLIGAAVAVIAFDIWFFFGDSNDPVGVSDDAEESWSPSDLLAFAVGGGDDGESVVPWREPSAWPLTQRTVPLAGELDGGLMIARASKPTPVAIREELPRTVVPLTGALPRLSVVLWDDVAPVAVLDTRVVQVGDLLDGFRVERISPDEVTLSRAGTRHRLPLVAAIDPVGEQDLPQGDRPSSEANP